MRACAGDLEIPLVPASYAERFLVLLETRGFAADAVLAGTGCTRAQLRDASTRLTTATAAKLFWNGTQVARDPSLGLEFGLSLKASSHGWLGFALLTCNTLGDAIKLAERYMELRSSPWRTVLIVEGDIAILRFVETLAIGAARTVLLETLLGAVIRFGELLLGHPFTHPDIEFWSDSPELPYHARFRDQVPRVRYECPNNEARFPAAWLDRPLALGEPVANREAVAMLEQERRLLVGDAGLLERVRALVANSSGRFPDLEEVARRLNVSSRTLRRHLTRHGTTFQALRDDVRLTRSLTLLQTSRLSVEELATELGYSNPSAFVRAFQRWTGETPSRYRQRVRR